MAATDRSIREELRKDRRAIEEQRQERRQSMRQLKQVVLYVFAAIGLVTLVFVVLKFFSPQIDFATTLFFIALVTLTSSIFLIFQEHQRRLDDTVKDIQDGNEKGIERIVEIFSQNMSNSTTILPNRSEIARAGARIIAEYRTSSSHVAQFPITFIGAPSMSIPPGASASINEDETKYFEKYAEELGLLSQARLPQERWISLMSKETFKGRGSNVKNGCLNWLAKHITLLDIDSYKFFDAPRAPRWSASMSFIITPNAALLVIGDAKGGALIKGDEVVIQLRSMILEYFREGENPVRELGAKELKEYRDELMETMAHDIAAE